MNQALYQKSLLSKLYKPGPDAYSFFVIDSSLLFCSNILYFPFSLFKVLIASKTS